MCRKWKEQAFWSVLLSKFPWTKKFLTKNARSQIFILLFSLPQQQLTHLLAFCLIFSVFDARKIVIKSNPDRNADLFGDKDFTFSQDKDDNKEPTIFKGDPMKSKVTINENVQGRKNFKFA